MAEVYRAKREGAEGIEKEIVLKTILPEYAEDERFVDMFISEAELAVELNHPNIVQMYDFGRIDGEYFLVMEYVEGPNLSEFLSVCKRAHRPMSTGDAVYVTSKIAEALHYAHEQTDASEHHLNIVHRDVTPDNVLVSTDGTIKITDFGIAQARDIADEGDVVKGKYQYMSPEQVRGGEVDRRSDLFSLGALLFEMLCGRPLFERSSREETISLVETAVVPDLDRVSADIPGSLQSIMYRALERVPDDRYQTARAMRIQLMEFLYDLGELHDAGTLAEHLDAVDDRLDGDVSDDPPATEGTLELETSTDVGATARQTETVFRETPLAEASAVYRERKHAVLIAGRADGLLTLKSVVDEEQLWRRVLDEYTRIVDSITLKHDGQVHHVDESGFLVAFGVPTTRHDDVYRAVRVARDLREAISGMNVSLDAPVRLSIGLAWGDVLVERLRAEDEPRYQWSFCGEASRLVDQLAEAAMATEILLGPRLTDCIRPRYQCESIADALGLEGEAGEAHRLLHPDRDETIRHTTEHPARSLSGRSEELERLQRILDEAIERPRATAGAIVGRRGAGKSALIETFRATLDTDDYQIIGKRCFPPDRETSMGTLAALYRELMGFGEHEAPRQLREVLGRRLEALFPDLELAERELMVSALSSLFHPEPHSDALASLGPDERRARIFRTLRRILSREAERKPVVILLDDAHHVDPVSTEFAAEYFGQLRSAPVLLAVTANRSDLKRRMESGRPIRRASHLHVLELESLTSPEARRLVDDRLRGHDLAAEPLVDDLVRWTGGNPRLIEKLVEAIQARADSTHAHLIRALETIGAYPDWLPASLEASVMARFDNLSSALKQTLQSLARIWSPFSLEEAAIVLDAPRSEVASTLESLLDHFVLEYVPESEARASPPEGPSRAKGGRIYRIRPGLMRPVVARTLPEAEATALHARVVDYIEDRLDEYAASDHALLARHHERAEAPERAARHYARAAEHGLDVLGARETLRFAENTLALTDNLEERYRAQRARSRALARLGRIASTEEALDRRLERARDLERDALQTETHMRRTLFELRRGQLASPRDRLDSLSPSDPPAGAAIRLHGPALHTHARALVSLYEGDHRRAEQLCHDVLAQRASREVTRVSPGRHVALQGWALMRAGRCERAVTCLQRGLDETSRPEASHLERRLRCHLGRACVRLGDLRRAFDHLERALDEARHLDDRRGSARSHIGLGWARLAAGRCRRAISTIRQGLYRARETEMERLVAEGLLALGRCYLEDQRYRAADRSLHQGLRIADSIPDAWLGIQTIFTLARVQLRDDESGHPQTALVQAEDGIARANSLDLCWGAPLGHYLAARALASLERYDEAREHAEREPDLDSPETAQSTLLVHYQRARALASIPRGDDAGEAIECAAHAARERLERVDDDELRESCTEHSIVGAISDSIRVELTDSRAPSSP